MPNPQPYEAWKTAVANKDLVRRHLSLIGKQGRTTANSRTPGGTFGHLRSVEVTATIYYQETDGGPNYHSSPPFNHALAEVVKARFSELAAEAELLLGEQEKEARRAMRTFVDQLDCEVTAAEQTA